MCLTEEERAELLAKLADAEKAYHALMLGQQARVVVDQNGERVEFTAANKSGLYGYIMSLRSALGLLKPGCGYPSGGPAGFIF